MENAENHKKMENEQTEQTEQTESINKMQNINNITDNQTTNHNNHINNTNNSNSTNQTNNSNGSKEIIYTPKKNWLPRSLEEFFEVEEQVGQGTYGDVFKARKKKYPTSDKNRYYALKEIKIINEKEEGFPITAIREISILNDLKHDNIINLKEIVMSRESKTNKEKVFLVFDYMDYDLSGLLKSKISLDLPQIKYILYQITKGINYLHKKCIVHRDIKSANILMNRKGDVRIGDFGLAKYFQMGTKQPIRSEIVTLWYRSPELLLCILLNHV